MNNISIPFHKVKEEHLFQIPVFSHDNYLKLE